MYLFIFIPRKWVDSGGRSIIFLLMNHFWNEIIVRVHHFFGPKLVYVDLGQLRWEARKHLLKTTDLTRCFVDFSCIDDSSGTDRMQAYHVLRNGVFSFLANSLIRSKVINRSRAIARIRFLVILSLVQGCLFKRIDFFPSIFLKTSISFE